MNRHILEDMLEILAYNWRDERNDYVLHHGADYDLDHPEEMIQHHIFTRLVRISNYLQENMR